MSNSSSVSSFSTELPSTALRYASSPRSFTGSIDMSPIGSVWLVFLSAFAMRAGGAQPSRRGCLGPLAETGKPSGLLGGDHDDAMDRFTYPLEQLRRDDFRRLRAYVASDYSQFST